MILKRSRNVIIVTLVVLLPFLSVTFGISFILRYKKHELRSVDDERYNNLYVSSTTNQDVHHFSFGETEYQCSGICYCEEGIRRNVAVKKSIFYAVSAVSAVLASEIARIHFGSECKEYISESCSSDHVMSEVIECEAKVEKKPRTDYQISTIKDVFEKLPKPEDYGVSWKATEENLHGVEGDYICRGGCIANPEKRGKYEPPEDSKDDGIRNKLDRFCESIYRYDLYRFSVPKDLEGLGASKKEGFSPSSVVRNSYARFHLDKVCRRSHDPFIEQFRDAHTAELGEEFVKDIEQELDLCVGIGITEERAEGWIQNIHGFTECRKYTH